MVINGAPKLRKFSTPESVQFIMACWIVGRSGGWYGRRALRVPVLPLRGCGSLILVPELLWAYCDQVGSAWLRSWVEVAAHTVVGVDVGINSLIDVASRLEVHDVDGGAA